MALHETEIEAQDLRPGDFPTVICGDAVRGTAVVGLDTRRDSGWVWVRVRGANVVTAGHWYRLVPAETVIVLR